MRTTLGLRWLSRRWRDLPGFELERKGPGAAVMCAIRRNWSGRQLQPRSRWICRIRQLPSGREAPTEGKSVGTVCAGRPPKSEELPNMQEQLSDIDSGAANGSPLVSVVTCVYNAGDYLRPAVLSTINQTYRNLEIVIIDDGSTDGCLDTITDLLDDRRIGVFRQANATRPVALTGLWISCRVSITRYRMRMTSAHPPGFRSS